MSKADGIRMRIAEMEDDIAFLEEEGDMGEDCIAELDTFMCDLADLRYDLEQEPDG